MASVMILFSNNNWFSNYFTGHLARLGMYIIYYVVCVATEMMKC